MHLTDADQWVYHWISTFRGFNGKSRLGVAVSGGSDSVALLHLLAAFAAEKGLHLEAATVNHNLRPDAVKEAAFVADLCKALNVPHQTLIWKGWDKTGNLQNEARKARYRLLAEWAQEQRLETVALGHTQDDQAETFLMRLARASGVDGLAAMEAVFTRNGAEFSRPALMINRSDLRDFLRRHDISWKDDASNEDTTFDRVKARKAMTVLSDLGIDSGVLQTVANNMRFASSALKHYAAQEARACVTTCFGDLLLDRSHFLTIPTDIQNRILCRALMWMAGGDYPPRAAALRELHAAIIRRSPHTLHGCLITSGPSEIRITRESNAVKKLTSPTHAIWDGRWILSGPSDPSLCIKALGEEGLKQIENWRDAQLPHKSLLSSPAIWDGNTLISAPLSGFSNGWTAELAPNRADFHEFLESH